MTLTKTQRFAYRLLGSRLQNAVFSNPRFAFVLQKAHLTLRPDVYLSSTVLYMLLTFAITSLAVVSVAVLTVTGFLELNGLYFVFLVPLPLTLSLMIYLLAYMIPELRAATRARDIDAKLPYALNYITIMASAGVTPKEIFSSLAEQPLYGEVANEAAWISRDLELLGQDLMTALTNAIDRSPSIKFQDFLQGAITALSSGESLKGYFMAKNHQFVIDSRQEQKRFLDSIGILAESYVTVVVAAPLLLIVLLTIMLMFGGLPSRVFLLGYLLILVLLPLAMGAFAGAIRFITPEV